MTAPQTTTLANRRTAGRSVIALPHDDGVVLYVLQHGRLLHSEMVNPAETLRRARALCDRFEVPAAGRPLRCG